MSANAAAIRRPVGFAAVEARFHAALQQQSMPHAWLLHGPEGIGKAMLARTLAADCLCERQHIACGACQSCLMMAAASHPDMHLVQRQWEAKKKAFQRDISIDQVRALLAKLSLSTKLEHSYRLAVIDAIDELNPQAANALLKHLEEPLPGSVLLLVCHDVNRVLPTIRSRCLLQHCAPLSAADGRHVLQGMGFAEHLLPLLLRWADGRPGLVTALQDNDAAMQAAQALDQLAQELAGCDLANMQQQLEQAIKQLPPALIARILYCAVRPQLAHATGSYESASQTLAAMMAILRWPQELRRHSLRPLPALFARLLHLRQTLRQLS